MRNRLLLGLLCCLTPQGVRAQNIPPMIGDHVGKPKIKYPNPLERAGQTQSGYDAAQQRSSALVEREVTAFLEGWASQFGKKDLNALGACYLQGAELRVYWESQEFAGWEPFKSELEERLSSPEGFQLELKQPQTRVFGRFAWVTGRYVSQRWLDGRPTHQEGRLTLILEKRRTLWTILHQHGSAIPAAEPVTLSTK